MLSTASRKIKAVLFSVWLIITILLATACGDATPSTLTQPEAQVTVSHSAPSAGQAVMNLSAGQHLRFETISLEQ